MLTPHTTTRPGADRHQQITELRKAVKSAALSYGGWCIAVGGAVHGGASEREVERVHRIAATESRALMALIDQLADAARFATPSVLTLPPTDPDRERNPDRRAAWRLVRRWIGGM